jgi:hypothetical protein
MGEPHFLWMTRSGLYLTAEEYGVRFIARALRRLFDNTDDLMEACNPDGRDFKWYIEMEGNLAALRELKEICRKGHAYDFRLEVEKDWRVVSMRGFSLALGSGPQLLCEQDHSPAKYAILISYDAEGWPVYRRHFFCGFHAGCFSRKHGVELEQ